MVFHIYIIKIKIHSSSCEIECFVETHLCKLCVILRSRVLRVVCPHMYISSINSVEEQCQSQKTKTGQNNPPPPRT